MNSSHDSTVRFTLQHLVGLTTYVAFTFAVISQTGSIEWGVHLSLLLIGWLAWRYGKAHLGGVIPILLGSDFLLCSSVDWVYRGRGEDFLGFRSSFQIMASGLVVVGFAVFVWESKKKGTFWKHHLMMAAAVFSALVAWWAVIPALGEAAVVRRRASDVAANKLAIAKAVAMVEEVQQRIGKAPEDESELLSLLSEPMPRVRWAGFFQKIMYCKTSDSSFQLAYSDPSVWWGDIMIYDSATKAWVAEPF